MNNTRISKRILRFFRSIKSGLFPVIIFLLLFSFPPKTAAQPGSDPGSQASRFRDISKGEQRALDRKKPKKPKIKIEEPEEKPVAPVGISFLLKEVKITGATVFKPDDFRPIYEPYLNKTVTFQDIEAIAGKIKDKYKKKGYLTTIVHIPEQEIRRGVVEIAIVEGMLGELKIEGNKWFSSSLIRRYIHIKKTKS